MQRRRGLCATVIVPTFNRAHLLRLTLGSLRDQSRDDFEVVVVDDGSTDHTKTVADEFARSLRLTYVFQPDEGFRVARARNLGIRLADAPICLFVDSGVVMHPDAVGRHVEAQSGSDVVVGRLLGFDQDNSWEDDLVDLWSSSDDRDAFVRLDDHADFGDPRADCLSSVDLPFSAWPAPWALFWTANASVRTDLLVGVGGFDEAFSSWGVEDAELGFRLHRGGGRFGWASDAVAFHHPHDKPQPARLTSADANRRYFARKFDDDESVRLLTTHRAVYLNQVLLGTLPITQGIR
jgi:glycosyltransferase involved in cell wall biosynthesis